MAPFKPLLALGQKLWQKLGLTTQQVQEYASDNFRVDDASDWGLSDAKVGSAYFCREGQLDPTKNIKPKEE